MIATKEQIAESEKYEIMAIEHEDLIRMVAKKDARIKELEEDLDTAIRMGRDLAGSKDLRIKELEERLTAQKEGV